MYAREGSFTEKRADIMRELYWKELKQTHELTHLLERLHNARFSALLSTHLPNWRLIKKELNDFITYKS